MKEQHTIYSPDNVIIVGEPILEPNDLQTDKVHLNETGKEKFYQKILADLLIGKEEITKFETMGMDWSNEEVSQRLSQKTPKTAKKRARNEDEDEEETPTNSSKKQKEDETVMGMLKSIMVELKEDRRKSSQKTEQLEECIDKLKESEIEIRQEVSTLLSKNEEDKIFAATMKEDLDAIENENMRNTVVVKKLKTSKEVSTDKIAMTSLVQQEAKTLVKELLGKESDIGFIGLLFTGREGLRATPGILPPFKVVFRGVYSGQGAYFFPPSSFRSAYFLPQNF